MLKDRLYLNSQWNEIVFEYVKQYKEKKIIVWGTGGGSDLVLSLLKQYNIDKNIHFYVDGNIENVGKEINGHKIVSPQRLRDDKQLLDNYIIIVASMFLAEIKRNLLKMGFEDAVIDVRMLGMAKDFFTYSDKNVPEIVAEKFSGFDDVYEMLNDDISKDIFVALINSKLCLDNKFLRDINSESWMQYFEKDLIKLTENEVFVDCGSFDGDTLEIFHRITNGNYKKFIAIEADPNNFSKLNEKISEKGFRFVETVNKACWHEETNLYFKSNMTAGHINDSGEIKVIADRIDNIVEGEKISFLKMDIEGAEENALIGAKKIIKECNPILAICIYHDINDYYKLPLLMKKYNNEYKFYIRHYTEMVDQETVCYAIPINRLKS